MAEVSAATSPHIVRDSAVTVTVTFDADPGSTTVAVTALDGSVVVASGAAGTTATATERTVALTGTHTADLDTLTATWTTTNLGTLTTRHEVVGAHLFSVAEARATSTALASTSNYPTAKIEAVRAQILDEFERITGRAFVPRFHYARYPGDGTAYLSLHTMPLLSVRSVETYSSGAWTAYDEDELADVIVEWSALRRDAYGYFTAGYRNVRVGVEYGYEQTPGDIKEAALTVLRYKLLEPNQTERALSQTTDMGTIQLSTPNPERNRWYGLPLVDAVLAEYQRVPVIA